MNDINHFFICFLVFFAIFDRMVWRRKSVVLLSIEEAQVKGDSLAFSIKLHINQSWISNATVEYALQDLNNPALVIAGHSRNFDISRHGPRDEFLLIKKRHIESGLWDFRVKVTNGNCRLNPLYRIFPLTDHLEHRYIINVTPEGDIYVQY